MKNIFHGLLIIAPFAALILFFAIVGKEEVKSEQRVQDTDSESSCLATSRRQQPSSGSSTGPETERLDQRDRCG